MLGFSLLAALVGSAFVASAQDISSANNVTSLYGTWSSGSGGVMTGAGFANPLNYSFTYPKTAGYSYSFDNEGHFEEAQYRFTANASLPNCITAIVIFQHGNFTLETNGSITLHPFADDGRIQVQDPCAATTNIITMYDQTVLYADWGITIDTIAGNYALQLTRFDGAFMPPMYLMARPPNMLPTVTLSGYGLDSADVAKKRKRSFPIPFVKRSAASPTTSSPLQSWVVRGIGAVALVAFGVML